MAKLAIGNFKFVEDSIETTYPLGIYFNDSAFLSPGYKSKNFEYGGYNELPNPGEVLQLSDAISSILGGDQLLWYTIPIIINGGSTDKYVKSLFPNRQQYSKYTANGIVYYEDKKVANFKFGNTTNIYGGTKTGYDSRFSSPISFEYYATTSVDSIYVIIFPENYTQNGIINFPKDGAEAMLLHIYFNRPTGKKGTAYFELIKLTISFSNGALPYWVSLNGTKIKTTSNEPFEPGGESGTGGGGGSFDNTSTPIEIPNLPSISAASTGFISLFNPSLSQLNELASYLWSDLFEIDGWKKLFADPMDAILGLSILPVAVPSGGIREVKVGNIGTGISLTIAASQFVEVDCGSIDVNEYWGAYLDYEPYTQAQIFLPYIGTRPISVDEIMGKTVQVVYHIDILTGACCCFVKCGDSVLYTYNGQCSIPIPITGANYTSVVNGVISIAASVGSLVATGGASAPTAIPAIASSAVNQMKPQIEKSGSISGSAGVLNMQTPYLILIRPRQALPSKQNEFIGYPSLITVQLTELSGYTEVQSIHLENIPATQEELAEIQSLLEGGVIF